MTRVHLAEYLDLDTDSERWHCHSCGTDLGPAREDYKRGLLVYDRDPAEIHPPLIDGEFTFSPNPEWIRIVEFYCPGCGLQVETEYLPPGHPLTRDTEIDIDSLKAPAGRRRAAGQRRRQAGGDGVKTIDIDVGGTFTDLVLTWDDQRIVAKAPTTPYDLSVGFVDVLTDGAGQLGLTMDELLPQTDMVRYSTTVAMNRLIERKGPRLGLLTTEGHEDAILIGRGAQWVDGTRISERRNLATQDKPAPLVTRDMIAGLRERVDSKGAVLRPLDADDVREKLRRLVDNGARSIAVALLWSFANPAHERRVREIIREEYRSYHVGIPAGRAVARGGRQGRRVRADNDGRAGRLPAGLDQGRAGVHLGSAARPRLPGQLHAHPQHRRQRRDLQDHGEPDLQRRPDRGADGQLPHRRGRSATATSSRAMSAAPASTWAWSWTPRSAATSSGRSSTAGWSASACCRAPRSARAAARSPGSTTCSAAGWRSGPRSAGSYPGPACYDLGGTEPTVTDADVVLGYISPDHYFGGRMPLSRDKAVEAIETRIAGPLGLGTDEAAALIRRVVEEHMASAIKREVHLRGYHPEDFVLFTYGGGGPTHVAGDGAGVPTAVIFPQSPVFSALGSSVMDIMHVYELSRRMVFLPGHDPGTHHRLRGVQLGRPPARRAGHRGPAVRGPAGRADAVFSVELDMLYGGQVQVKRVSCPVLVHQGQRRTPARSTTPSRPSTARRSARTW